MNPFLESREFDTLEPGFATKAKEVIQRCSERGVEMRPFFTLRGPGSQARLFCRSRTMHEVYTKAQVMQKNGAHWLASLLSQQWCVDYPQRDPKISKDWATNAEPGLSWHQWGRAIDCGVFYAPSNKLVWGKKDETPEEKKASAYGFAIYTDEATKLGLMAGGNWTSKDWVHIQAPKTFSPISDGILWPAIEETMIKRFQEKK